MSATRVTVGIPTFNRAEWLGGAIQSVLAQTFTNFRLIVSDNASDDATPDVVRSFSDSRIDYVRSERNIGPAGNFNRLIALAKTEFFVLLPDDDVLYPDHLGAAVEVLDRFASIGLVHSAFDVIDERSHVTQSINPLHSRSPVTIERSDRVLERLMVSSWPACFSSVVYRTKAIIAAGGFRDELEPFGDIHLWMRMALDWDFGCIAKSLVGFRVHRHSASMNIGTQAGVASDHRELALRYAQIRWQRRLNFLDDAGLNSRTTKRLHALATLQLLVERASVGLPGSEVRASIANLVRTYPRIMLRPALWRLVVAELGGRRIRSALREPWTRYVTSG
jgi:glycosyltransferase involved in cell wall biosynthesis